MPCGRQWRLTLSLCVCGCMCVCVQAKNTYAHPTSWRTSLTNVKLGDFMPKHMPPTVVFDDWEGDQNDTAYLPQGLVDVPVPNAPTLPHRNAHP